MVKTGPLSDKLDSNFEFDFSAAECININKLLKLVRTRLNSSGKTKHKDENDNVVYVDCDIFSVDMLAQFLILSLSEFNQTPYFTNYSFEDTLVIDTFTDVLVEGAVLAALASQALVEKGREFKIQDNGVYFDPPSVSEMLNTQYATLLAHHAEKLKLIKNTSQIFEFKKNKS